jgi:hypothetical protein
MTPAESTVLSVALLAVSLGSLVSVLSLDRLAPLTTGGGAEVGIGVSPACPSTTSSPSAALDIVSQGPSTTLVQGTVLSVAYEVQALTLPSGSATAPVELPGVTGVFPLSNGAVLQVFVPPQSLVVSESAWSSVSAHSRTLSASSSPAPNESAQLTTQLLAVTTPAPVGSLRVEVRWSWSIASPDGSTSQGPWTVPSTNGTFPSIFSPDPYVGLAGQSPTAERSGAFYSVELSGTPAHSPFLLKLENASTGATLNRAWFNSTSVAGAMFTGSIQLTSGSVGLPPGNYLIHVHDACAGILYSLPVVVSSAAAGSVSAAPSVDRNL